MKHLVPILTLLPAAAQAHPGDHQASGLLHLVTEPDHLAIIAAVVAVLGYGLYKWARS